MPLLLASLAAALQISLTPPNRLDAADPALAVRDLRTSASLAQSLWRETGDQQATLQNLLGVVERRTNALEAALVDAERRRNQLLFQCRDSEPISFVDTGDLPLKSSFRVVDPVQALAGSIWQRGPPIQSRTAGQQTIAQLTDWEASSPSQASLLLLKRAKFVVGETDLQVGIRPAAQLKSTAAGVVFGYQDPANFYFTYLALGDDASCELSFGRLEDGTLRESRNLTCPSEGYGSFRELTLISEPLSIRFYVDEEPVGEITKAEADYQEGSVGLMSLRGTVNFGAFNVGGERISPRLMYSAAAAGGRLRDEVVELFERKPARTIDRPAGPARRSGGSGSSGKSEYSCFTYKPTHVTRDELACTDAEFWRIENSANGTALYTVQDLKTDQSAEECWVRGWSCRESEVQLRLTFNSDGEAGVVLRSQNRSLETWVTVETVSQKVTVAQVGAGGVAAALEVVSGVPVVAHETNVVTVRDVSGKIAVLINGQSVIGPSWVGNAAERPAGGIRVAYGGGFVARRGAVRVEGLQLRGL